MKKKFKNYGVILGTRSSDFVAGTIPYEIRNPSGDWTPFLPDGEIQRGNEDWMDCVSRSLTNSIEIQEWFLTEKELNYNDRELALGSNTTRQGNYLWKVADYARNTGLALQSTWPDSGGTFDEQYTPPAPNIRANLDAEKKDWLSRWSILHEDIPYNKKSLQYHLKHAPIQCVIPGHAILGIYSNSDIDRIMDSYPPYVKQIPGQYPGPIIFAKKIVLYKKATAIPSGYLLQDIKYGDFGKQVEKLIDALVSNGWNGCKDWPDIYDDRLKDYVFRFQLANLPRNSWSFWWSFSYYRGKLVDKVTREILNKRIK